MRLIHRALFVGLALTGAVTSESSAQIFLASKAHPDFAVGPLFLIANVPTRAGFLRLRRVRRR